jgi:CheY-like chemotaxis protein
LQVLVVEDNAVNRMVISALLGSLGVSPLLAEDGQQGVQAVQTHPELDLVLMDVQMPVLDGYGATQAIRAWEAQQPQAPHLPVIALTADAFAEHRQQCLQAGMDDFLTKPINRAELLAALRRWAGQQTAPVAAST